MVIMIFSSPSPFGQMIEKAPKKRLGCRAEGQDLDHVKTHPWFSGVDWDALDRKAAQAPFVPDVGLVSPFQSHLQDQ